MSIYRFLCRKDLENRTKLTTQNLRILIFNRLTVHTTHVSHVLTSQHSGD